MEPYVYGIIATTAVAWCLLLSFGAAILAVRIKGAELLILDNHKTMHEAFDKLIGKVPEARLQEVETALQAFRTRIDQSALENDNYREAVHKSMQRFDQIMRRNERALISKAEKTLTEDEHDDTPDEIPLGDVSPPSQGSKKPTRAELRAELRAKGRL